MADQSSQDSDKDGNAPAGELTSVAKAAAMQGLVQGQHSDPAWAEANERAHQAEQAHTSDKRPRKSAPSSSGDLFAPKRIEVAPSQIMVPDTPPAHSNSPTNTSLGTPVAAATATKKTPTNRTIATRKSAPPGADLNMTGSSTSANTSGQGKAN